MAGSDRWYFSKEVLANTPSRRCGIDADKELSYRQQAANLIQDMGQRLHVSQLCINTAIVYMHRFYTFHSFTKFHRNSISSCALFLAAKVEEQPRKLEHVIKVSHMCLHRETPAIDIKSEAYQEQAMELVFNENLMLQTLGFDIAVEHPHTSVVNCCQLVRASKDLAQTSYFMATNSLHLTTMCLQYKPTVVACVCIHLACKWSSWEIPRSSEGKDWFYYVDKTVTLELLERLTSEFLAILDKCPSRLKRKIMAGSGGNPSATNAVSLNKSNDEKKSGSHLKEDIKPSIQTKTGSQPSNETIGAPTSPLMKKIKTEPSAQQSNKIPVAMSYAAYRERKERTQQDSKQLEQSVKSNQSLKSLPPFTTRESIGPQKDKFNVSDKISAKQQQINIDKQRQIDERHKLKTKNPEYLWDNSNNNRQTTSSKPISSSIHTKTPNNVITEDFYDNLLNKPSNFNSIFSTDGEDSLEFKKEITTDLKMEFSDNSNLSNDAINLSSFPTDFINDSSDSKKSLNNSNNNNNNKLQTNAETKTTSFMSIFSSPVTNPNPIITPIVNLKSENTTTGIPMKFNDFQNMLSRLKPEPPPPMLSPLKSAVEIESVPKLEKPLYPTHSSSVAPHMKSSSNQNLDLKQIQNLKSSKTPPKNRNVLQSKPSIGVNLQNSPKEKEVIETSHNIGLDINMNQTSVESFTSVNNCNNNNNFNSNDLSHTSESIAPVAIKQENKEKPSKGAEVPSALSYNRTQMSSTSNPEIDIKPNIDFMSNVKQSLHSSPPQKLINNMNLIPDQSSISTKATALHNKDVKEKTHEERHSDKHHKHSHHSHKSSKHKDKHKHKHKDKDREKHKRKDKDRDRDREKHNDSKEDPSYKLSWSSPKEKSEVSNINSNIAPIKLKISKKKLSVDSPDKDNDVPQNPLKLRIQLKDQKLTANTTDFESNDLSISSERKRKSSPKSSKKEKKLKYETDFNSKSKDDKNSTKTSSKSSKKSNDSNNSKKNSNSISDERYSTQTINSFGHQMLNLGISGQPLGGPQGVGSQRSSKAHK